LFTGWIEFRSTNAYLDNVDGHVELTTIADGVGVDIRHDPRIERLINEIEDVSTDIEVVSNAR
jgi:hypothetical protein